MYKSTIYILLFFTLSIFNLYGNVGNYDKKEYLKDVRGSDVVFIANKTQISRKLIEVPDIQSIVPSDENKNVSTDINISITFKKSIDTRISIIVQDSNGHEVSGKTKRMGTQLIFTPYKSLKEETKYSIKVTQKLNDREGLYYIYSFSFNTGKDETKPKFISSSTVDVKENQKNAITLIATDKNKITYSISGNDSYKFNINSLTGVVTFKKLLILKHKIFILLRLKQKIKMGMKLVKMLLLIFYLCQI